MNIIQKSDYYNDICFKATSNFGTDITLNDRRNEFVENNMTLCEENCELIKYDPVIEKANCSCDIKLSITPNYDIKFNKEEFFKNFKDVNTILNLSIMKCYKIILQIKSLKNNYGSIIVSFIFLFYFITLLIFLISSFDKLKKEINQIILSLNLNEVPKEKNKNKKQIVLRNLGRKKIKKLLKEKINFEKKINNKSKVNDFKYIKGSEKKNSKFSDEKYYLGKSLKSISNEKLFYNDKNNAITELKDFELNSLDYKEALKLDHRSYFEYYISL